MTDLPGIPPDAEIFRYKTTYPAFNRPTRHMLGLVFFGIGLIVVYIVLATVARMAVRGTLNFLRIMETLPSTILVSPMFFITSRIFVAQSHIALSDGGVWLYIIWPIRILIPWDAMRHATIIERRPRVPAFSIMEGETVYLIRVPGLTIVHRLNSFLHGLGFASAFVVTSHHERHELLMERLRQAASQENNQN